MKLSTNTSFETPHSVTAHEAVAYCAERAERRYEDQRGGRARARMEALESMLGHLIGALIDNGALRTEQVELIFDYDIAAED